MLSESAVPPKVPHGATAPLPPFLVSATDLANMNSQHVETHLYIGLHVSSVVL